MKRKRPSKHYRVVKTKRGRKKVLVNESIKKKERGIIKSDERKMFKFLSNPNKYNKEFGGAIDFDKSGKIEQINVTPGDEYEIFLPPDYEVQYHTHPDKGQSPPTPDDIVALLKNRNQQAEIIFKNGKTFVIVKTPLTKALSKLPATQLHSKLGRAFNPLYKSSKNPEDDWMKKLQGMGFQVYTYSDSAKDIPIFVHPVEPKKHKRKRRVR